MNFIYSVSVFALLATSSGCTSPQELIQSLESKNDTYISMRRDDGHEYSILILQAGLVYVEGNFHPRREKINIFRSLQIDSTNVNHLIDLAVSMNFFDIKDSCIDIVHGAVYTTIKLHGLKKTIYHTAWCGVQAPWYKDLIRLDSTIDSLANIH